MQDLLLESKKKPQKPPKSSINKNGSLLLIPLKSPLADKTPEFVAYENARNEAVEAKRDKDEKTTIWKEKWNKLQELREVYLKTTQNKKRKKRSIHLDESVDSINPYSRR